MQGEASTRLGFTDYFRADLAWAKLLGVVLLLAPGAGASEGVGIRRLAEFTKCLLRPS